MFTLSSNKISPFTPQLKPFITQLNEPFLPYQALKNHPSYHNFKIAIINSTILRKTIFLIEKITTKQ